ncbi:hypothetical protein Vadar_033545 [Vaccinium darrowii]|uniref:Uncharacterized protein n=1 Tax=Vaccinium darrowii TaxID=229202 RepID=A0ACB7ZAD4_9ERIC|nr:hypothetical protein Vadar_033545 [Vaccinium darrowii]
MSQKCQKRKDLMRLWLLLTYLQNCIEEPWQRIPSITAKFVAEASVILLDPLHDHYSTISKFLISSTRVNMKSVPLFANFLWSSSVNFRTDRLWMLRLLYAGLDSDDDARIYIRNNILEILLVFYASPLLDIESKELILQGTMTPMDVINAIPLQKIRPADQMIAPTPRHSTAREKRKAKDTTPPQIKQAPKRARGPLRRGRAMTQSSLFIAKPLAQFEPSIPIDQGEGARMAQTVAQNEEDVPLAAT